MKPFQTLGSRGITSFDELTRELNGLPDQTVGRAYAISDIGEPYVEFLAICLARPGDEKIIETVVVAEMCKKLDAYFEGKSGRIYWRIPFETDVTPHEVVLRLDVNGPDLDFATGSKCVKDKNWIRVAAYCRLIRATLPVVDTLLAHEPIPGRKVA